MRRCLRGPVLSHGERSPERVTQRRVSVSGVGYPGGDYGAAHPEAVERGATSLEPAGATASQRASSAGGHSAGLRGGGIHKAGGSGQGPGV